MMQDRKALQAGTSHNLGQNFAKAFDVQFQDKEGKRNYVYATSWGVSTRLIGALVMAHSDDNGLVIPPKLAQKQVVIIPIWKNDEEQENVMSYANAVFDELKEFNPIMDDREKYKPGFKFAEWELQGIPLRIEIGPKDVANNKYVFVRRDLMQKEFLDRDSLYESVKSGLENMQKEMLQRAKEYREKYSYKIDDYDAFKEKINSDGGFIYSHWCGNEACERKIKNETKSSIRCIPFDREDEKGICICCAKESEGRVIFAKAY